MKVSIDIKDPELLVPAVVAALKEEGVVMMAPEREEPFSINEIVAASAGTDEGRISRTQISRMIEAGVFKRVPHTARVLVTAASVRAWQRGEGGKKK